MNAAPAPPVNVRVVLDDRTAVPVQTRLDRVGEDGIAVWEVIDAPPGPIIGLKIDVLPPRTAVALRGDR